MVKSKLFGRGASAAIKLKDEIENGFKINNPVLKL